MMKEPRTERESKWHDQRNQDRKVADTTRSAPLQRKVSVNDANTLSAIGLCWVYFYLCYFLFFGRDNVYVDNELLCAYFFVQALGGILSISLIFFSSLITLEKPTTLQKTTSIVLLLFTVLDVFMGVDAFKNLEQWTELDMIYDFIHGDSERIIAFGAKDAVLIGLGYMCMSFSYYQSERH